MMLTIRSCGTSRSRLFNLKDSRMNRLIRFRWQAFPMRRSVFLSCESCAHGRRGCRARSSASQDPSPLPAFSAGRLLRPSSGRLSLRFLFGALLKAPASIRNTREKDQWSSNYSKTTSALQWPRGASFRSLRIGMEFRQICAESHLMRFPGRLLTLQGACAKLTWIRRFRRKIVNNALRVARKRRCPPNGFPKE